MREKIVLTDHAWPDVDIERIMAAEAGYELVAAQIPAGDEQSVETLVADHNPVAIMTCWALVSARAITSPMSLKVVARLGVGLDNIAIGAATARGAWVTNVPDYCVEEVSDHAIAMLLDYWRGITAFDFEVKAGRWQPSSAKLHRVRDKCVGIVGYGKIGRATARKLADGFGCRVLVNSPSLLRQHSSNAVLSNNGSSKNISVATIEQIQEQADAIVLHLPLTESSRYLVNDAFLAACRRKPVLINVSRGGLIDNDALVRALDQGSIARAALDVVEGEPTPPAMLVQRRDVVVTPHIAFTSDASLLELRRRCMADVLRVLRGERPVHPCNVVDAALGPRQ